MTRQEFSQMLAIASENAIVKINDCLPSISSNFPNIKIDVLPNRKRGFQYD